MPGTNVTSKTFQLSVRVPKDIAARINRYGEHLKVSTGAELSQAQVILSLLRHGLHTVEKKGARP
jgi:hypothetical protein